MEQVPGRQPRWDIPSPCPVGANPTPKRRKGGAARRASGGSGGRPECAVEKLVLGLQTLAAQGIRAWCGRPGARLRQRSGRQRKGMNIISVRTTRAFLY